MARSRRGRQLREWCRGPEDPLDGGRPRRSPRPLPCHRRRGLQWRHNSHHHHLHYPDPSSTMAASNSKTWPLARGRIKTGSRSCDGRSRNLGRARGHSCDRSFSPTQACRSPPFTPADLLEAATTIRCGSRSTRCLRSRRSTVGRERDRGVNTYSGKRKYRSFVISFLPEKTHGEGK